MDDHDAACLLFLATSAVLRQGLSWAWRRKRPPHLEYVGTVQRICLYPLKSASGLDLEEVQCSYSGCLVEGTKDRQWAVLQPDLSVMTAKDEPKLVLIRPSLRGDKFTLDAPGMDQLTVPRHYETLNGIVHEIRFWRQDFKVLDCGDVASKWVSTFLEKEGCRLIHCTDLLPDRPVPPQPDKQLFNAAPRQEDTGIAMKNERPYLLGTTSSLQDLNSRLKEPIPMDRFRPNFVIDTNCMPYDEDNWREIYIGEAKFSTLSMCDRCPITTIDQSEGTKDPLGEPLRTLWKFRKLYSSGLRKRGPCFNSTLTADWLGTVRVGDPVYVLR